VSLTNLLEQQVNYGGTYITLMRNLGFSEEVARNVENGYHNLHAVSDLHIETVTALAAKQGFIELAFGLRLRCPTLKKSIVTKGRKLSSHAAAISRTINNAESQSYGQLLNRSMIEVRDKILVSEYFNDILLMNVIHDAGYFLVREDANAVNWLNIHLIQAMEWQADPKIQHDKVKLGAELDIGRSWAKPVTLKNNASLDDIQEAINNL